MCTRGSFENAQTRAGRGKARVDHMELNYDSKNITYHVLLYLYCITYLSTVITILHNVCFKKRKPFCKTQSSHNCITVSMWFNLTKWWTYT
jgi:hypothetical protein